MRNGILAAIAAFCILPSFAFGQADADKRDTAISGDSGTNLRTFKNTFLCNGEGYSWAPVASNC